MKQVTFSLGKKFLILNIISITLCGFLLGAIFLSQTRALLLEHELETMENGISQYKSTLSNQLTELKENVQLLSRTPPITGIIRSDHNNGIDPVDKSTKKQWINRLTHIFEDFLASKPKYISLRLIGVADDGKEIIRVSRIQDSIKVTHRDFLQTKGHRDYFKSTIGLKAGQVYLSRFELNKEYGKVALPYTPVIRAATPVFDENGKVFGIIIANMDARKLLGNAEGIPGQFYVTDSTGNYLHHPNIEYTFGFDLGLKSTIQEHLPETMEMFSGEQKIAEKKLVSAKNGDRRFSFFSKLRYTELNPSEFLGIVISEYESRLSASVDKTLYKMGLILILLVLLNMLLVYVFARHFTQPLMKLILATGELAEGKTKINFPTGSNDETGVLAASLEAMHNTVLQRDQDIKSRELMNRSVTDNLVDGLVTITADGLIKGFNPAAEKLFGYEAGEIIGHNVSMLMPAPYKYKHDSYMDNYAVTRVPKIIGIGREVVGERKNGTTFPMELSVSEMNLPDGHGGHEKFFIGLCRNIEERKKAEIELKKAEQAATAARDEAEKANKAKSEFLSRMSHELRTPLNAILGFSQLELEELKEEGKGSEDSNIRPIYDAGKHLLELVNEVLDLAKIESNNSSLNLNTIEPVGFLENIHKQTLPLAQTKSIKVELLLKFEKDNVFIKADIVRLTQILLNFVSNAIKYNSEKGTVTLEAEELENDRVRLSVKDNGFGIPENKLPLLFQPLERLGAENSGIDGTGIGLMISKQLTERMGGVIGVESVENVGSNFYVEFPRVEADEDYLIANELQNAPELAEASLPKDRKIKILYIEDNPTNMAFVQKILGKHENIDFIPANNPVTGLNAARKHRPDLVLLDLHLPDIDGFEVFECLKGYDTMQDVPIIALSASAIREDVDKAAAMGFYSYIVKPFEIRDFYGTIAKALAGAGNR